MADKPISAFSDGGAVQSGDEVAIVRSGDNYRAQLDTMASENAADYTPTAGLAAAIGAIAALTANNLDDLDDIATARLNLGLYSTATVVNAIAKYTSTDGAMDDSGVSVDSSNNVTGINDLTIGSAGQIFLADGTAADPSIAFTGATGSGIYRVASNNWALVSNGSVCATAISGGSLVVGGTANAGTIDSISHRLSVNGTTDNTSSQLLSRFSNNANGALQLFAKSRGASVATNTTVQASDVIAEQRFYSAVGSSTWLQSVNITVSVEATISGSAAPGKIVIKTANQSGTLTDALEIASDQIVKAKVGAQVASYTQAQLANEPGTPAAAVNLYARTLATLAYPGFKDSAGQFANMQAAMFSRMVYMVVARTGDTSFSIGPSGANSSGTVATESPIIDVTSTLTRYPRISITTSASSGQSAYLRSTASIFWRGDAAGRGGFFVKILWANKTTVANSRTFTGLWSSISEPGNVEPNTLTNIVGVGSLAGEANLSIMYNDGSGTATMSTLGANFPARTDGAIYELTLYSAPNGGTIEWSLERFDSAQFTSGSINTNLPANNVMLSLWQWINNGSTASAVATNVIMWYGEAPKWGA